MAIVTTAGPRLTHASPGCGVAQSGIGITAVDVGQAQTDPANSVRWQFGNGVSVGRGVLVRVAVGGMGVRVAVIVAVTVGLAVADGALKPGGCIHAAHVRMPATTRQSGTTTR